MKKRRVFTGVAGLLGALFLGCVLWVGGASGWFGLSALAAGEEPAGVDKTFQVKSNYS